MAVQKITSDIISPGASGGATALDAVSGDGTGAMKVPKGTTAQRPSSPTDGYIRYNTSNGSLEQYNSAQSLWTNVGELAPTVSNISGVINTDTNSTITVSGTNFQVGAVVSITGSGVGGVERQLVTTYVSPTTLTAETNATSVTYTANSLFNVKVTNPSGLNSSLSNAGTVDRDPVWNTAAGSLGTFNYGDSVSVSLSATDPDGSAVTYSVASGSLPGGVSLNSSTGALTGSITTDSTTTYTFSINATGNGFSTARSFTIATRKRLLTVNSVTYYQTGTTQTVSLTSAGTVYPMTVHAAHSLTVTAVGAAGSSRNDEFGGRGRGGSVTGTYASIPAGTYYTVVGATTSGATGGYPGGGNGQGSGAAAGGGGFSGFWSGTSDPLASGNRSTYYLVGGAGAGRSNDTGAGNNGSWGTIRAGYGGYPSGGAGNKNSDGMVIPGGGTQSAGGSAGLNVDGNTQGAGAGSAFYGGASGLCSTGAGDGGAGGGGWFGGGGGNGHCGQGGGAGGGGSSYYNSTYISNFSYVNDTNTGNGSITLQIV